MRHEDGGVRADGDQARAAQSLAARCARSSPHWPQHAPFTVITVLPLAQFSLVARLRPCIEPWTEQPRVPLVRPHVHHSPIALGSLAALFRLRMGGLHRAGWSVADRRLPLRMAILGRWLLL